MTENKPHPPRPDQAPDHGHDHSHDHGHDHDHDHGPHHHRHDRPAGEAVLVIRPHSGLAGDIMAAGLLAVSGLGSDGLDKILAELKLEHLIGRVSLIKRQVNEVGGFGLEVNLPEEHQHRGLRDMEEFFGRTDLSPVARDWAIKTFRLLAEAEGAVHGLDPADVHFHEVGALDSIMDIGLVAALVDRLSPDRIICGPLPVCDGVIKCQHGLLPAPAPAVMRLLEGVPVTPMAGRGETVTPTAMALLKGLGVEFGPWPEIVVEAQALAYGARYFPEAPNGALFVRGRSYDRARRQPSAQEGCA